jgi:hypothetical protein
MSKYLSVFEGRIRRQRQEIGKAQAQIMAGRNVAAARKLIAKAEAKIAEQQKLIAVNQEG